MTSAKRKILQLCTSPGVGGLELYAVRSVKPILQRCFSCVAVARAGSMTANRMVQQPIPVFFLRPRLVFMPVISALRLSRIIDREQVDIIHMHWGKDLNLAVLAKILARREVRIVYSRQMVITRPKFDLYHRFLYRNIGLFITISLQLLELARNYLPMPQEKIRLLYYGVQKPQQLSTTQKTSLRSHLRINSNTKLAVGLVGRIERNKGQHLLIDALYRLKAQALVMQITIIGPVMDKSYMNELRDQVRARSLTDEVNFYGSHENPIDIMSAFDVLVLTSEMETFGLVLIEAMRNGVAVIGTNAGGVPEIIDDNVNGLLFEPNNAIQLSEKLALLYNNANLRQQLALRGRERADEMFSLRRHYDQLASFFMTV